MTTANQSNTNAARPSATPELSSVKAKYEGGVLGYNQKLNGTLVYDDANKRLLFRDKNQREVFSIPYASVTAAFADTQARTPKAATVAGSIPVPYGLSFPARFIKKKYRYLTLQFNDPDTRVSGTTSFKVENKETLAAALNTLANKAGLSARGEAYVRRSSSSVDTSTTGNQTTPPKN
jgi:hypothetical protein